MEFSDTNNTSSNVWLTRMAVVILSIFTFFVSSCFSIPTTIHSGPMLVFAYNYSLLQMVEVVVFLRVETLQNSFFALITLLCGLVIPLVHIRAILTGDGDIMNNTLGWVYLSKEFAVHILSRGRRSRYYPGRLHITVALLWVFLQVFFQFFFAGIVTEMQYATVSVDAIQCVVRFTPVFMLSYMTVLSVERQFLSRSLPTHDGV